MGRGRERAAECDHNWLEEYHGIARKETDCSTEGVDIRVRVSGGGHTSQIYAIRQAIAKSIVRSRYPPPRQFRCAPCVSARFMA